MRKLIAHRGLKIKDAKENSQLAFQNALENKNYAGFECDIRTTKDHEFVIHHNSFFKMKRINDINVRTLKKYKIPTLKEVLDMKTEKLIVLEIKEINLNIKKFHQLLAKYPQKNIYVMSFHNSVIKQLKALKPTYKLGILNYVLNSEETYHPYDFICLLETIYTDKLYSYFQNQNMEVFLYGVHKENTYRLDNNLYIITDKIVN